MSNHFSNSSSSSPMSMDNKEKSLAIVPQEPIPQSVQPPLSLSYDDRIRPLLDAVDKLRQLQVTNEGIQLPTIVVVGDQSSGKSSVLESLAGITLPRGQGICTRVPLIMRLQSHASPESKLQLEYNGKTVDTDETVISESIEIATDEIAGSGKQISNIPLTLVVKKQGVPDLTMVDLPGITRVPVHGQPEDIYEQISSIIMEYIKPEESIILNVLSATVDFPTCESIRMSQKVDKTGQRTLAVVTKSDKAPEGLLEKVTADDVNIGLGYVCVRNRIGNETYEEARIEEANLFRSHHLLSKISKSMVGIPVLAERLVNIQATIIARCLPEIVRKINVNLNDSAMELRDMPRNLSSVSEAIAVFMKIIGSAKESLRKIILRGEFDEYPDEKKMHCSARLAEIFEELSSEVQKSGGSGLRDSFLLDEINVLVEAKGVGLPNFLPRSAFLALLQGRILGISDIPLKFVEDIWNYIEMVVTSVLMKHCSCYSQVKSFIRRTSENFIMKMKEKSKDRVMELVEMEKCTDFTCDPDYIKTWNELMASKNAFENEIGQYVMSFEKVLKIEGFGEVEVNHLRKYDKTILDQAFDMKMRITAYWKIVMKRLVDSIALHVLFNLQRLINSEMEMEFVSVLLGAQGAGDLNWMLEELPSIATKRERLKKRVSLLKDSKEVVSKIMDRLSIAE